MIPACMDMAILDDKNQLPVSLYGRHIKSVITDEDIAQEIHLSLKSLDKKYLCARDIVQYLDDPVLKEPLGLKIHHQNTQLSIGCMPWSTGMASPRMACMWMVMNMKCNGI